MPIRFLDEEQAAPQADTQAPKLRFLDEGKLKFEGDGRNPTGADIVSMVAQNPSFAEGMTRDEYIAMRRYQDENPVGWGAKAAAAAEGVIDIFSEGGKQLFAKFLEQTSPVYGHKLAQMKPKDAARDLLAIPEAIARVPLAAAGQLGNLGFQAIENSGGRSGDIDKELEAFKLASRGDAYLADFINQSPLPKVTDAGTLAWQPETGVGALAASTKLGQKASQVMAAGTQKLGQAVGAVGRGTVAAAEFPEKLVAKATEALTNSPEAVAKAQSLTREGLSSLPFRTVNAAARSVDVVGEVTQKVSERIAAGASRTGAFEGLSRDLSASTPARVVGSIGYRFGADAVMPYLGATTRGAAAGSGVGSFLGFLENGEDGAAAGFGAGLVLGAGGGIVGRGFMDASGETRRQNIINDAVMSVAFMDGESRSNASKLFDQFMREGNHEAVAEMVDARNWTGADIDWKFITNEQAKTVAGTAFEGVTVSKKDGSKPTIYINVDLVKPGTGFHESFHGAMRSALGETYAPKFAEAIQKTYTPAEIRTFVEGYIKRGADETTKAKLRKYLDKGGNLPEEVGAEYFRQFLQRPENRDMLMRGERTTTNALINATKDALDFTLNRMGVTEESAKTGYKGMDKLVTELVKARTAVNRKVAKSGKPLTPVELGRMPTPDLEQWAKDQGQSDVLLRDKDGNVVGIKTEEQVSIGRDDVNKKAATDLANVPNGIGNLTDAALDVFRKHASPDYFAKLVFMRDAINNGTILNGDYFPASAKDGEGTVYASRGMTTRDFVPYKISVTKKGAVTVSFLDVTQLKARFDDYINRPGVLDNWNGDRAAAWRDVAEYSRNLALGEGKAVPSAELLGGGKLGAQRRDIVQKIYGFVLSDKQRKAGVDFTNRSMLGENTRRESGTGKDQIGKPAFEDSRDTRVVGTFRLDRMGRIGDTKAPMPFNEGGYALSQVNFKPAQQVGEGRVFDSNEGFRIINKGKNWHLYSPDGQRIGIYETQAKAEARANDSVANALPRRTLNDTQSTTRDENGNLYFQGKAPKDWSPEDFAAFGKEHGVDNLGPLSAVREVPTGLAGNPARIPGGLDGKFTYYDLLWLKANPVDVKALPEQTHAQLTAKLARTMAPEPGDKVASFNSIVFGMLSPNAPLLPNEIGQARLRFGSMDDIRKFAALYPENPTKENLVKLNETLKKRLGFTAAGKGGLGIPITANLANIVNAARMFVKNPDFFVKQPGESWANFVDKLTTQVPGFGTKTGSFGSVWQDPLNASISAMDRHMARIFGEELMGDKDLRQRFEGIVVDRFNKLLSDAKRTSNAFAKKIAATTDEKAKAKLVATRDKELASLPDPAAAKAKSIDDVLGQAEIYGADRVREFVNEAVFAAMGSRKAKLINAKGDINPNAPEHLKSVQWIETPQDFQVMSDAYRSALEINERRANELGVAVFPAQWTLWDRIRQRVEPHEAMFPGLEKLPALNDAQLADAYKANKVAGYMSTPKPGKKWKRSQVKSPAQLAYFMPAETLPHGKVWRGENGVSIVQRDGGKFRVYGPLGLLGVAASYEKAQQLANRRSR